VHLPRARRAHGGQPVVAVEIGAAAVAEHLGQRRGQVLRVERGARLDEHAVAVVQLQKTPQARF